jgi:hypothetical protein
MSSETILIMMDLAGKLTPERTAQSCKVILQTPIVIRSDATSAVTLIMVILG